MKKQELKKQLAQKMLDEKLSFLSLEDSLLLKKNKIKIETNFYWVGNIEEVGNWEGSDEDIIKKLQEFYGEGNEQISIGDYDTYAEYTHVFCKAPTYIDLIR